MIFPENITFHGADVAIANRGKLAAVPYQMGLGFTWSFIG